MNALGFIERKRTLHEIAVRVQEAECLVRLYDGKLVLEVEGAVIEAGGVEERAEIAFTRSEHGLKFAQSRRRLADGMFFKSDALRFQPLGRAEAGGA